MKLYRILLKQDKVFKGDWNPTDGGTPANRVVNTVQNAVEDAANAAAKFSEDLYKATVKATEDAMKSGGNVVNNVINVSTKAVNDTGTAVSKGISDTGKTAEKTGQQFAEGDWIEDSYKTVSKGLSDYYYYQFVAPFEFLDRELFNSQVDKNTGGVISSAKNAAYTLDELAQGNAVDDNLKDGIRLSLIAATTMLTAGTGSTFLTASTLYTTSGKTAGYSERGWGEILSGVAQQFLPGPIAGIVGSILNPPKDGRDGQGANYDTFYTPTSAADKFVFEGGGILPAVIVGGGAIVVILLLSKLKKH